MSEPLPGSTPDLYNQLHQQTARIRWPELQRHYARGVLVIAAPGLDLIAVATTMAQNNTQQIKTWITTGKLRRALDDDARRWQAHMTEFWSCVVAPWVLVQEIVLK
jgi:hypothetical protein